MVVKDVYSLDSLLLCCGTAQIYMVVKVKNFVILEKWSCSTAHFHMVVKDSQVIELLMECWTLARFHMVVNVNMQLHHSFY